MSLARWSKAYCHSQSTTCTTPWSLASRRLARLAQFHQLLEAGGCWRFHRSSAPLSHCAPGRRTRWCSGAPRRGWPPPGARWPARVAFDLGHPAHVEGLGGGDDDLGGRRSDDRQARRSFARTARSSRRQRGRPRRFKRVYAQVVQATAPGQPFGERFEYRAAWPVPWRVTRPAPPRRTSACRLDAAGAESGPPTLLRRLRLLTQAVFAQPVQQHRPLQPSLAGVLGRHWAGSGRGRRAGC